MNTRQKRRLHNIMMKYKQVLANWVEFKLEDFEEIDSLISALEDQTIRQLIMDLETKEKKKIYCYREILARRLHSMSKKEI